MCIICKLKQEEDICVQCIFDKLMFEVVLLGDNPIKKFTPEKT